MDIATGATSNGQDVASGLSTAERKLRCDMPWKQLRGARLKAVARPCDNERVQIAEHDPDALSVARRLLQTMEGALENLITQRNRLKATYG